MLKTIEIKDFAIISSLKLAFGPGLNVFTGETGAGKSIVIEALGFLLGARGDSGIIKQGARKMIVSAEFSAEGLDKETVSKFGLGGDSFSLRRELDLKGRNKAWINDKPVLVGDLAEIGSFLVDFHGQHEHQSLFKASAHLDLLDNFAGLEKELSVFKREYQILQDLKSRLAALEMSSEEKQRALDLYKYQLEEIERLNPREGEDEEIEEALPKLKNSGRLLEESRTVYECLSDMEGSAAERISKALDSLRKMAETDKTLESSAEELSGALNIVEDVASTVSGYQEGLDADPDALDKMLSRHEELRRAKAKYGPSLKDVLDFAQSLKEKISNLDSSGENVSKLKQALEKQDKKLLSLNEELNKKRLEAAGRLAALVRGEIAPLGFGQVRFEVSLETRPEMGPKGDGTAEFLFSSNPGQALRPLRNIASGGEISRLMLGLKTVLAGSRQTMIFDEIDSGISGLTGKLVGRKMMKLAKTRQVICVTHLAQVAACGQKHFSITKTVKGGDTEVEVRELGGEDVVLEIARMIGSSDGAKAGRQHAADLLAEAAQEDLK